MRDIGRFIMPRIIGLWGDGMVVLYQKKKTSQDLFLISFQSKGKKEKQKEQRDVTLLFVQNPFGG